MTEFQRDLMFKFGFNHMQARVAEKLVEGKSSLEIAQELTRDSSTIKGHIGAIYRKVYGEPPRDREDLIRRLISVKQTTNEGKADESSLSISDSHSV